MEYVPAVKNKKQKMSLKISIVIPSYNMGGFIEETIKSIVEQDYPDYECIVMDGGSTDNTIDILKKYQPKITWKSEKDNGQSDAINKGLRQATGEIVTYINADDMYEAGCFRKIADFTQKNPDIKWLYGKCRIVNDKNIEIRGLITRYKNIWQRSYSYNKLLVMDFLSQPAVFWRKEMNQELGYFDVNDHLSMEYDFWLRLGAKYRPGYINDYLARFRIHPASKSSLGYTAAARSARELARKHARLHKKGYLVPLQYLNYCTVAATYSLLDIPLFKSRPDNNVANGDAG
jgi:glycosyltransferase involved in cell wall biosynthesis